MDHLPSKATIYFCEIDLECGDLVSKETLAPFLKEIRQKASRREKDIQTSQKLRDSLPLFDFNPLDVPIAMPLEPETDLSNITSESFPSLRPSTPLLSSLLVASDDASSREDAEREAEALSLSYAHALNSSQTIDLDDENENPPLSLASSSFPPLPSSWAPESRLSSASKSIPSSFSSSASLDADPVDASISFSPPKTTTKKGRGKKGGKTVISLSSLHKN